MELEGHALFDSGDGWKLERFGELLLARPDPQALWRKRLPPSAWKLADLSFERESDRGGRWIPGAGREAWLRAEDPQWCMPLGPARALLRPTPFKHLGVFPEQAANWKWTTQLLAGPLAHAAGEHVHSKPRVLNLFGYTGVASVLAARGGALVTHVDASRASLSWMRENARVSGLAEDAVRLVLDDALAFARREVRRGSRYEVVLLDPPHYGRGPKGEVWQLEEHLAALLEACGQLLASRAALVLSTYAVGVSPLAFTNLLEELRGGRVEAGELVLEERPPVELGASPEASTRLLPCGFCARFERGIG